MCERGSRVERGSGDCEPLGDAHAALGVGVDLCEVLTGVYVYGCVGMFKYVALNIRKLNE